ncbi:hypothetical protein PPERSA_11917 [Pseudocohnilembus persalinus]|uniref:FH2 domain-containing protein n=1 Tax=Pseudocohnilembus persalinus TaxID=266149 RepID=A0A0V0QK76_PSEPJ|nr:hypothetical protein PPERSA_11917 [Pseudocohnilembus persalinus]|eukprot:KRX02577.1 hypothetical protein PPERSA_11917 [Pseudocohnilembus persalinus]
MSILYVKKLISVSQCILDKINYISQNGQKYAQQISQINQQYEQQIEIFEFLADSLLLVKVFQKLGQIKEARLNLIEVAEKTNNLLSIVHNYNQTFLPVQKLEQVDYQVQDKVLEALKKSCNLYSLIANLFYLFGDYKNTENYYILYSKLVQLYYTQDSIESSNSYFNLGVFYLEHKFFLKALSVFKLVLKVRQQLLGDDHPSCIQVRKNQEESAIFDVNQFVMGSQFMSSIQSSSIYYQLKELNPDILTISDFEQAKIVAKQTREQLLKENPKLIQKEQNKRYSINSQLKRQSQIGETLKEKKNMNMNSNQEVNQNQNSNQDRKMSQSINLLDIQVQKSEQNQDFFITNYDDYNDNGSLQIQNSQQTVNWPLIHQNEGEYLTGDFQNKNQQTDEQNPNQQQNDSELKQNQKQEISPGRKRSNNIIFQKCEDNYNNQNIKKNSSLDKLQNQNDQFKIVEEEQEQEQDQILSEYELKNNQQLNLNQINLQGQQQQKSQEISFQISENLKKNQDNQTNQISDLNINCEKNHKNNIINEKTISQSPSINQSREFDNKLYKQDSQTLQFLQMGNSPLSKTSQQNKNHNFFYQDQGSSITFNNLQFRESAENQKFFQNLNEQKYTDIQQKNDNARYQQKYQEEEEKEKEEQEEIKVSQDNLDLKTNNLQSQKQCLLNQPPSLNTLQLNMVNQNKNIVKAPPPLSQIGKSDNLSNQTDYSKLPKLSQNCTDNKQDQIQPPVFWEEINAQDIQNTVFGEIQKQILNQDDNQIQSGSGEKSSNSEIKMKNEISIIFEDLEEIFQKENKKIDKEQDQKLKNLKKDNIQNELINLFQDNKKHKQIQILISSLKRQFTIQNLIQDLKALKQESITPELCEKLVQFFPNEQESQKFNKYKGDTGQMGFKISSILKYMTNVKSASGNLNLIQYCVEKILAQKPEILRFVEVFENILYKIKNIDIQEINKDIMQLNNILTYSIFGQVFYITL